MKIKYRLIQIDDKFYLQKKYRFRFSKWSVIDYYYSAKTAEAEYEVKVNPHTVIKESDYI